MGGRLLRVGDRVGLRMAALLSELLSESILGLGVNLQLYG